MARYIDIEELHIPKGLFEDLNVPKLLDWLKSQPTADVVEVKHGEWKNDGEDWFCTRCNHNAQCDKMTGEEVLSVFCPHCGVKMDLKD